jgi:hypothetical protein
MSTDFLSNDDLAAGPLHRIEASFEALNARIARLAIGLGVPLDQDQHIQAVLSSPHPLGNADPHHVRHWTELRGVLVLRYGMEKNYAEQIGADTLRQILTDAEEHLAMEGFKPGADGLRLTQLFGKA